MARIKVKGWIYINEQWVNIDKMVRVKCLVSDPATEKTTKAKHNTHIHCENGDVLVVPGREDGIMQLIADRDK
jgi:hypothetical protein